MQLEVHVAVAPDRVAIKTSKVGENSSENIVRAVLIVNHVPRFHLPIS